MKLARMNIGLGEEFSKKLNQFGKDYEKIAKKVVMAGASPVADEIRKNLEVNLRDPAYCGYGDGGVWGMKNNTPTGDLLDSMGIAPARMDKNGNTNTKVGFAGYDRKGVPNALKARAMESGTSKLRKRPFVRPAVNKTRQNSIDTMEEKLEQEIKIYAF